MSGRAARPCPSPGRAGGWRERISHKEAATSVLLPATALPSPLLSFCPSLFLSFFTLQAPCLRSRGFSPPRIPSLTSISSTCKSSPFPTMSCGNGCGCCPKCGCRATCTCNRNTWFNESMCGDVSYTVAGESGKCGDCNCAAGTCAKEGASESFSVAGENSGKCGNCDCQAGTCAKEGGNTGKCGGNSSCPAGTCVKE